MTGRTRRAIEKAKRYLAEHDIELAVFTLRDLPEAREEGLTDLLWTMSQGNAVKADVEYIIKQLEEKQK